jgi:hypothetical protein
MYNTYNLSTLVEIYNIKLLSLFNVILYKLQAKSLLNVKARILAKNVSSN